MESLWLYVVIVRLGINKIRDIKHDWFKNILDIVATLTPGPSTTGAFSRQPGDKEIRKKQKIVAKFPR